MYNISNLIKHYVIPFKYFISDKSTFSSLSCHFAITCGATQLHLVWKVCTWKTKYNLSIYLWVGEEHWWLIWLQLQLWKECSFHDQVASKHFKVNVSFIFTVSFSALQVPSCLGFPWNPPFTFPLNCKNQCWLINISHEEPC